MGKLIEINWDGMKALETVREFFDDPPKDLNMNLCAGDRFLAWLWTQGYRVVPVEPETK